MIRHPFLLAIEAAAALLIAVLGHLGSSRPVPKPVELRFGMSVLGESETSDGSWSGSDLLMNPRTSADRFQLTIHPQASAQLTVDAIGSNGAQRIFPEPGQDGLLKPGVRYSLPAPNQFYELQGEVKLRVSMRPIGFDSAKLPSADALPERGHWTYPLSDGVPFRTQELSFAAPSGGVVELELGSVHQGVVVPSPTASE